MVDNKLNKKWKEDFFEIFATKSDVKELENADKIKIEHFPPVLGHYYPSNIDEDTLIKLCEGKLFLTKSKKQPDYDDSLIKIDYEKVIKTQLNTLMQQQIAKLQEEDPNFLKDDEKEIIKKSSFPFIKLMTLVYSKDTKDMSCNDQKQWKEYMNQFITQQIVFSIVNTYYTMKLYQDNIYTTLFQTPYNKDYVWKEYGYNHEGICVTYNFKEIRKKIIEQLQKIFPVYYINSKSDINYDVYNSVCASLLKTKDKINTYDNQWAYIMSYKYTETEYTMLDNLLEPVYTYSMTHSKINEILNGNYLEIKDNQLDYNYKKLIENLVDVLNSNEFQEELNTKLQEVYDITQNNIDIDFMKPEAVYLGRDFPEEKIKQIKEIVQKEDIMIFKIKQSEDKLFKALI